MSALCGVCGDVCKDLKTSIKCSGSCNRSFHLQCVKGDGVKTRTGSKEWKCEDCGGSVSSKSSVEPSTLTKEFLISVMEAFKREVFEELKTNSKQNEELRQSVQFLSDAVDTSNKLMAEMRKDYSELKRKNEELERANRQLSESMDNLQERMRAMEQYSRKANIEISGLPVTPSEHPVSLLRDVGKAVGVELRDDEVVAAHRVPTYKKDRTPSLVVQFHTRNQRDVWIMAYKKKKGLVANEVNKSFPTNRVYINEHMSPENKRFFAQLKEKCKQTNFKYVWFREGNFYVRKNEGDKPLKINKVSDLTSLN